MNPISNDLAGLPPPAAPRRPTVHEITAIWERVINVDAVTADDDFFDLGGHSLLAMQILSEIHATFHIYVSLSKLFEEPTVAGLMATIDQLVIAAADDVEVESALTELMSLSDEEARSLIDD